MFAQRVPVRALAPLLGLAVGLTWSGCGGASAVDRAALMKAARAPWADAARKDAAGFCNDFTAEVAKRLAGKAGTCQAAMRPLLARAYANGTGNFLGSLAKAVKIAAVSVHGSVATAQTWFAVSRKPHHYSVKFVRGDDGKWRVATPFGPGVEALR